MNEGQDVVGVRYGFGGLARGDVWDLQWMDVQNWISMGGSELGAIRHELTEEEIGQIAVQVKHVEHPRLHRRGRHRHLQTG